MVFCVGVVSVDADAVVTAVVTGVLTVDGHPVANIIGAVVLSVNKELPKGNTALILPYSGCIFVDSTTAI